QAQESSCRLHPFCCGRRKARGGHLFGQYKGKGHHWKASIARRAEKTSEPAFFATCVQISAGVAKSPDFVLKLSPAKTAKSIVSTEFSGKIGGFFETTKNRSEAHGLLETFTRFLRLLE